MFCTPVIMMSLVFLYLICPSKYNFAVKRPSHEGPFYTLYDCCTRPHTSSRTFSLIRTIYTSPVTFAGQHIFERDFSTTSTGRNDALLFPNPPTCTNTPDIIVSPRVSIHLDTLPKLNPPNLAGKTFSFPPQSQLPPKTISSLPLLALG